MMLTIGIVGLGNIGTPVAANLLAAGFDVVGYDLKPNESFVAAGGRMAHALSELARADVVVQSLPSVDALWASLTGLLPHLRPGQVVLDISSYPLEAKSSAADRAAEAGAILLDCEVSGLPFQVAQRTAVLLVSGDGDAAERCRPVFEAMFAKHFYLGEFGAATKMKLIANYMVCVHNLVAAEALVLGQAVGLDPSQLVEVIAPSGAGSNTFGHKAPLMVAGDFENGRGPFRFMFGYLDRVHQLADDAGATTSLRLLDRVREVYSRASDQNRHDQDIAAVIEVIAPNAARLQPSTSGTSS